MNIGEKILLKLKEEIPDIEYKRYIKQLTFDDKNSSSDNAIFYAPNTLIANYIKTKFSEKISHLFEVYSSNKVNVLITLPSKLESQTKEIKHVIDKEKIKQD